MLEFVHAHYFYCEYLFGFSMLGSVDIAVLAFSDALHEHVVLDHFIHFKLLYNIILNIL